MALKFYLKNFRTAFYKIVIFLFDPFGSNHQIEEHTIDSRYNNHVVITEIYFKTDQLDHL